MTLRNLKSLFAYVLLPLLLCVSAAAGAHRFHFGMTDISYNARTKSTEIVHTYTAHDIDALLLARHGRQFDLGEPEDQQVLRKYIESQFWLAGKDGKRLPVKWVGMTVDAQSVTVYQELEQSPLARTAVIHQGVLMDLLPEQLNTVNINEGGAVHSLTFMRQRLEQPAR